jgi:hypothetical protein
MLELLRFKATDYQLDASVNLRFQFDRTPRTTKSSRLYTSRIRLPYHLFHPCNPAARRSLTENSLDLRARSFSFITVNDKGLLSAKAGAGTHLPT